MNKKIKIIELLNKIANGEEVPKSIKYVGNILKYDETIQEYKGLILLEQEHFFGYLFVNKPTSSFINEEVEILEEIEELKYNVHGDFASIPDNEELIQKINELVKAVNKMKEGKE